MRLNLKIAILESGQSQRQIARACGLSANRMSEIVRGWVEPREAERRAIAAAIGRPTRGLFEVAELERRVS